MTAARGTALALGLVALFALITVNVVDAREPLDASVARSFDSVATARGAAGVPIIPAGCRRHSLYNYDCAVGVVPGTESEPPRVTYHLVLRDDGCWTATDRRPATAPAVPREIQGCIDD